MTNKIEGVGDNVEMEINNNGGKQSKTEYAFHLVDAGFLSHVFKDIELKAPIDKRKEVSALRCISFYMNKISHHLRQDKKDNIYLWLVSAIRDLEPDFCQQLLSIAKRLKFGQNKGYAPNNWRLIPREEHLNHAIMHIMALIEGNEEDDHKAAALCRLHMAMATKETEGFSYNKPMITPEQKLANEVSSNNETIKEVLEAV